MSEFQPFTQHRIFRCAAVLGLATRLDAAREGKCASRTGSTGFPEGLILGACLGDAVLFRDLSPAQCSGPVPRGGLADLLFAILLAAARPDQREGLAVPTFNRLA